MSSLLATVYVGGGGGGLGGGGGGGHVSHVNRYLPALPAVDEGATTTKYTLPACRRMLVIFDPRPEEQPLTFPMQVQSLTRVPPAGVQVSTAMTVSRPEPT